MLASVILVNWQNLNRRNLPFVLLLPLILWESGIINKYSKRIYESEIQKPPFPRSEEAIKALAVLRGSEAGFTHAEAFYSIK